MPDEADPEILEIVRRQLRQDIVVDRIVMEGLGILLQLQPAQPGADIHRHDGVRFTGSDAGAPSETAARSLSIKCRKFPEHDLEGIIVSHRPALPYREMHAMRNTKRQRERWRATA